MVNNTMWESIWTCFKFINNMEFVLEISLLREYSTYLFKVWKYTSWIPVLLSFVSKMKSKIHLNFSQWSWGIANHYNPAPLVSFCIFILICLIQLKVLHYLSILTGVVNFRFTNDTGPYFLLCGRRGKLGWGSPDGKQSPLQ